LRISNLNANTISQAIELMIDLKTLKKDEIVFANWNG